MAHFQLDDCTKRSEELLRETRKIFEEYEDLNLKNRLHCMFMKALGLYGKGLTEESKALFEEALAINPNHFQMATHYNLLTF